MPATSSTRRRYTTSTRASVALHSAERESCCHLTVCLTSATNGASSVVRCSATSAPTSFWSSRRVAPQRDASRPSPPASPSPTTAFTSGVLIATSARCSSMSRPMQVALNCANWRGARTSSSNPSALVISMISASATRRYVRSTPAWSWCRSPRLDSTVRRRAGRPTT